MTHQDKHMPDSKVIFNSEILQDIRVHARSSMNEEICGVLIGKSEDSSTRVTARIPAKGAIQAVANVTFTQEAWENIYKIKDSEYPDESIVGWYHSHPGFGIFLSEYDLFIHNNFFNSKHQIAWVYDPHSDEEGCFGWVGEEVKPIEEITVLHKKHKVGLSNDPVTAMQNNLDKITSKNVNATDFIEKHKRIIKIIITIILTFDFILIYKEREAVISIFRDVADFIYCQYSYLENKTLNKLN